MFNLFDFQDEDLSFLINETGQSVTVNGISDKVLITNKSIGEFEERYIHSPELINRGSLIEWNANKYLVTSEALEKRGGKYKVIMRNCNGEIEVKNYESVLIGYGSQTGKPIYEDRYVDSTYVNGIVDKKTIGGTSDQAINVLENEFILRIQDNDYNREKFVLNFEFLLYGEKYKIINVNYYLRGILEINIEFVSSE
ncbi:hypothetical protein LAV77_05045 [Priestia megaterium]|uniref:hypothetical protein n=1 Tax=Priestia megaterium TaxID=1404 RepID=UPI002B256484|nr:hypothetical protein [Priestia megaterium]MEB2264161.1 hypothetical protein [Priestia megaterium]